MLQQKPQPQPQKRPPFLLKFTTEQKPRRVLSLNRLNYPENLQKDGTFVAKKDIIEHQLFQHHIVQTNMKIQGELKKLQIVFVHQKVPEFYVYHFMNRLAVASQEKIEDKIVKQLQEMKAKRSFYHVITNAIKAREGCLKQLQRCLENLFNNQEDNLTRHVFRQQITHYRKLTGFVISHIRTWKEYLNGISPEIDFTTFLYQGEDYLIKIMNDCEFIFNSFLSRHLKFSYRNDPYIMRPYVEARESKYYDLFKFDDDEKGNYMIDLNYLASERAKYLESKMNSKNQKMKQIERIYHYRDVPLTSRIIIRRMPNASAEKRDQKQQKPDLVIDNFMSGNEGESDKKVKLAQLSKKGEKIRKIKEIFGKTSEAGTRIINQNMFETIGGSESKKFISPYQEKLKYTEYHQKKGNLINLNYESDFENLLRKKELDVLRGGSTMGNMDATKTQRSFKNLKLKDNLSDSRKFITNQQGFNELEKILNQLDTYSPQKLDNFKLKKKEDPAASTLIKFNEGKTAKSRIIEPQKTLLQHNQEVYVNVRNQVIEQIEKGMQEKELFEQKRKEQNEKIQNILQKKINEESLRIIKDSRAKQLEGRQHLAKQMSSSQLFGYDESKVKNSEKLSQLQEQLKKEMQLKWLREVQEELKRKTELSELEKIKAKQQKELNRKLEKVAQKQELQKRYQQIQREEKAKAMQKMIDLQEERKKQIEAEMREIIEKQKESMEKFAALQRSEVEQELKQAMKAQMLANVRNQNERFYDNAKKQEERVKKQEDFRQEVRTKIEEEYRVGQQMKKNREREQKLAKIRLVKEKLGEFGSPSKNAQGQKKLDKVIAENLNQKPEEQDMKQMKSRVTELPDFRESLFPKYQKNSEMDKRKLRQQFELELFAFRKPETYQENPDEAKIIYEEGKFPIKDFKTMIDQNMVEHENIIKEAEEKEKEKEKQNEDIPEIKLMKPQQGAIIMENRKGDIEKEKSLMAKTMKSEANSDKFTKFSNPNSEMKEKEKEREKNEEDELIRMKLGMSYEQYQIYKKKKNAISIKRDIDGETMRKKAQEEKKAVIKVIDEFEKMDNLIGKQEKDKELEEQFPDNLSVTNQANKIVNQDGYQMKQQDIEEVEQNQNVKKDKRKMKVSKEVEILTINSRVSSFAPKRFETSQSEEEKQRKRIKNKRKASKKKKKNEISDQNPKEDRKLKIKPEPQLQQIPKASVTTIKKRQIPVTSFSDFFNDHFQHLPKTIKKINIYKKQELIKFLLEHSSFTILQYIKESISIGFGVVLFNENKNKYRSLNIVHLGSYDENDYLQLLLNVVRYCFKNDPCEEITMSNIYDKEVSQQWEFVRNFEKKFDPYGAIFQKKIFNTQFERKFVLRRNIGETCKVEPISKLNRGLFQLHIHSFITESKSEFEVNQIVESDQYEQINFNVGYYGVLAHYISERYSEETLAFLISKSTEKDSSKLQKTIASLAKLSLAMKKNKSFQRLSELTESKYENIMNLNLQLLSKHEAVLPYPPDSIQRPLSCLWTAYDVKIQLSYDFYSQTIPIKIQENKQDDDADEYLCKYLRYTPNKKNKMFTLKSSAYSSKITVLPCKENKYKIFVLDPEEYEGILGKSNGEEDRLDLGVYLRVFFANIVEHDLADYDHIWLPETNIKSNKNQFSNLDAFSSAEVKSHKLGDQQVQQSFACGIIRSNLNYTYLDYLGNSLKVLPSHRDLVITPPFIIGVLNMQIETALEGSPVFVQRIGRADMAWIKEVEKKKKDSD